MALLIRRAALLPFAVCGCFQSTFLDGLPCEKKRDCDGQHCIDGFCGGPPETSTTGASATTTTSATMTTDATTTDATTTDADESSSSSGGPACELPPHQSCDGSNTLLLALELGCAGEWPAVSATMGATQSFSTSAAIGGFSPRAGERFAIVGSGLASELTMVPPKGDPPSMPMFCSDDVVTDDVLELPSPLTAEAPAGDCIDDPALIGEMLDCSHTLTDAVTQVRDYAELRVGMEVPDGARSFSFDFAFSSTEFPAYQGMMYNDLFVAWLVSDMWTGNVAFAGGSPISVNSDLLLPAGATAALVADTCMRDHGTTGWLTTSAPVEPGEEIAIVFAVFDQGDSIVDSFVFLDAFAWSCAPVGQPETHA
ncbi:MAG TPA: choice-of-anchor L domain-containing protein [Nannocystaceae bacterium]|nr:choice-of-anchor L domain-containing protein [Nannocystaceae bacterium]